MNRYILATGLIVAAMVIMCGCTSGPVEEQPAPETTATPATSLTPGPIETLPSERGIDIRMEKDPIDAKITIVFTGGRGQAAVKSIDVRVTRSDGMVFTENLPPIKGEELEIQGTKDDDRIEVTVSFNDGTSYKFIDEMLAYRTRG